MPWETGGGFSSARKNDEPVQNWHAALICYPSNPGDGAARIFEQHAVVSVCTDWTEVVCYELLEHLISAQVLCTRPAKLIDDFRVLLYQIAGFPGGF